MVQRYRVTEVFGINYNMQKKQKFKSINQIEIVPVSVIPPFISLSRVGRVGTKIKYMFEV